MAKHSKYQELWMRAYQKHQDCHWIYSDQWFEMFVKELQDAVNLNDQEWIKELESGLE